MYFPSSFSKMKNPILKFKAKRLFLKYSQTLHLNVCIFLEYTREFAGGQTHLEQHNVSVAHAVVFFPNPRGIRFCLIVFQNIFWLTHSSPQIFEVHFSASHHFVLHLDLRSLLIRREATSSETKNFKTIIRFILFCKAFEF